MTTTIDKDIYHVSHCARMATSRGGSFEPFRLNHETDVYEGFLENWDDERIGFLKILHEAGFKNVFYKAPYHWQVRNATCSVEYVEGDLYLKKIA